MLYSGELKSPSRIKGERSRAVFLLLGLFAFLGWFYVVFFSDLLTIRDVEATGLKMLDAADVKRVVFDALDQAPSRGIFPKRHGWFIDKSQLSESLKSRLFAENVVVDKINGGVLRLIVEERSHKLVFHSHQQYLWVDLQGLVTSELTSSERKDVQSRLLGQRLAHLDDPPVIHKDLDELIATGYRVSDDDQVKQWIQTTSYIIKQGILYREFEPPTVSTSTQAIFVSQDGYDVYIDLATPLNKQLESFIAFLKTPNTKSKVSQYVDIRVPGRLYIK